MKVKKNTLIYLAIPYTFNPKKSFNVVNKIAAKLMEDGLVVFSPISHGHVLSPHMDGENYLSQKFWMNQDLTILKRCDQLFIVHIGEDGGKLIENSEGCQEELKTAKEHGIPIVNIYYKTN